MAVKRFAVSIPEKVAKRFEKSIENMEYGSRSNAVADALNEFTEKNMEKKDMEVGTLVIKGKKSVKIKTRLDRIKNHYEDAVLSTFRDTEKKTFVDIWIVKGKGCMLTKLKTRVNKMNGVVGCWLFTLKNGHEGNDCELKARMVLEEDIGKGDVTSENVVPENMKSEALIRAKGEGILCGTPFAWEKIRAYDRSVEFECLKKEGSIVKRGEPVIKIKGSARTILACKNTVLNLLMKLSGVATNTSRFVERIKPYKTELIDTCKTTPGYRMLEKYAVKTGGGKSHRIGLFDGVLVQGNHIKIAGSVEEAVSRAKKSGKQVSVEVCDLKQLGEALKAGAEHILLDDMELEDIRQAVKIADGKAKLEASGEISLEEIEEVAKTGVDYVSVGSNLSLSAPALGFSLEIENVK